MYPSKKKIPRMPPEDLSSAEVYLLVCVPLADRLQLLDCLRGFGHSRLFPWITAISGIAPQKSRSSSSSQADCCDRGLLLTEVDPNPAVAQKSQGEKRTKKAYFPTRVQSPSRREQMIASPGRARWTSNYPSSPKVRDSGLLTSGPDKRAAAREAKMKMFRMQGDFEGENDIFIGPIGWGSREELVQRVNAKKKDLIQASVWLGKTRELQQQLQFLNCEVDVAASKGLLYELDIVLRGRKMQVEVSAHPCSPKAIRAMRATAKKSVGIAIPEQVIKDVLLEELHPPAYQFPGATHPGENLMEVITQASHPVPKKFRHQGRKLVRAPQLFLSDAKGGGNIGFREEELWRQQPADGISILSVPIIMFSVAMLMFSFTGYVYRSVFSLLVLERSI